MNKHFERNWEEFMKGNLSERPQERVSREDLARMFYEFGISEGVLR